MNQASAPWPSHSHGCCSDLVVRERKVLRPSSLLLFCLLFSCFLLFSRAFRSGRMKPDVSPLPCPPLYRGCGRWHLGNGIHHLMRSLHPSDTNIAEGSIFLPPEKKKILKFLNCLSACTATRSNKSPCTLVHPFAANVALSP